MAYGIFASIDIIFLIVALIYMVVLLISPGAAASSVPGYRSAATRTEVNRARVAVSFALTLTSVILFIIYALQLDSVRSWCGNPPVLYTHYQSGAAAIFVFILVASAAAVYYAQSRRETSSSLSVLGICILLTSIAVWATLNGYYSMSVWLNLLYFVLFAILALSIYSDFIFNLLKTVFWRLVVFVRALRNLKLAVLLLGTAWLELGLRVQRIPKVMENASARARARADELRRPSELEQRLKDRLIEIERIANDQDREKRNIL